MIAYINGEEVKLTAEQEDLSALLHRQGFCGEHFAVAVNGCFVAKAKRASQAIVANDRIEVLAPMVGG